MVTRVLIQFILKPNAAKSPIPMMLQMNLILIGQLVSDMLESVDGRTLARTGARTPARVPSYKLTESLRLSCAKTGVGVGAERWLKRTPGTPSGSATVGYSFHKCKWTGCGHLCGHLGERSSHKTILILGMFCPGAQKLHGMFCPRMFVLHSRD